MKRLNYDFHIHSCLSPCGDDDNTPNNIAGMASLCSLQAIALTDHNSTLNCPAFFAACERYGLTPIPGMELTTAEDIHAVCLFPSLGDAMAFGEEINSRRILIKNRVDIFGNQLILNGDDELIGTEENFLTNATTVPLDEAPKIVDKYHGVCYPAHIDRQANGIISVLGTLPPTPAFSALEINQMQKVPEYTEKFNLQGKRIVVSSDAHYLTQLRDKNDFIEVPNDCKDIRKYIINSLKGCN